MVKNAELWELARKIESFAGFTEDILADPTFVDLFTQIIELRVDAEKVQGEIGGYRQNVDNHITEILDFRTTTTQKLEGLQKENENLRAELVVLYRAVATLSLTRVESSKVKIPEPKAFSGARSAKELENFIWDMEQYFTAARVPDADKLNITTMYLSGDAKLWWRTRNADDVSAGRPRIDTWDKLIKEMRDQFLPSNASWLARDKLKRLRQTGSVREYIKEFTSVMLDIQNMSDEDKLHNFISGMQGWAQNELRRQNVKDLPGAIAAADSLVDFRTTRPSTDIPSTSKTKKKNEKKGEWRKDNRKDNTNDKGKAQMKDGKDRPKNKDGNSKGCWTCGGPHLAKSCPNREKVNALLAGNVNQREEDEEIVAAMANPLGLSFNHIMGINNVGEISSTSNPHASLIHIEMKVKEQCVMAMVDTGATHTFVDVKIATKLGLKLSKSPSYVKTVNAKAQAIVGMAYGVSMSTGSWVGKHNLMVMPLGDFEIILGIDFLRKFQFVPFPHLDGVMVMNGSNAGFLKGVHPFGNINKVAKKKDKGMLLSAMSIDKGLKKGEDTILAALVEIKPDVKIEVPDCVGELLKQYADVMPPELPKKLPPRRDIDHKIELLPGTVAPAQAPYRMAPKELVELRKQLNELLDAGLIQPSKAPYGAPVLFQKKQDGTMRMCVDYRALNKATIKNKYPVPLVQDLMDRLSKACWFTKLDLRAGYWQVRIAEGDEPKTTCVTRYGSYEFLVMPFGLTNAPATFCNLMNNVLFDYLDDFVVVYLDDIVIYSRTLEEHVNHLSLVLSQLRKYTLYVKMEKCEFTQQEIKFLGHLVSKNQVRMDPNKVQAIVDWQAPRHVKDLRLFAGYSKKAASLTNLLKKDAKWVWSERCEEAFQKLKDAIASEPILKLPDFELPFEVHTDASDKAIVGVLVQEGHPVAFGSRKLNDAEQRYSTHEKEMVAVVHCLQIVSKTRHRGLIHKYDGPFEVVKRVGEVAYRLKLPERLKIHPTFHVSFLKPYFGDEDDPDRNRSKRAPPSVPTQYDAEIEKILDHRVLGTSKKNTKTEFLVHWKGKSAADAVWEKAKDLWQFDAQSDDYLKTVSMRTSSSSGAGGLLDPQST
ncbi:uncharacterized protein LOC107027747 [Solanum pennellii]|uniref:Uncharacterized protein LOC107027747 n=1 Tax=Solanum pennellii TaxID=28526 RepID=A0ABM1HEB6_SOLPN|nr:uncharacterized protein LOC107027747 [Solanum pennellii]